MGVLTKALTGLSSRPRSALGKRKRIKSHLPHHDPAAPGVAEGSSPPAAPPEPTRAAGPAPRVDYSRERAAFARAKPELIAEYPGQYVVFVGDEMIGPFGDFSTALRSAYRTFGRRAIYAKQLIEDDSVR